MGRFRNGQDKRRVEACEFTKQINITPFAGSFDDALKK